MEVTRTEAAALEAAPPPRSVSSLGKLAERPVTVVTPSTRHRWDQKHHVVETVDGSVGFHVLVNDAEGRDGVLLVTVLVDYGPTQATFEIWNPERSAKLETVKGKSGVRLDVEGGALAADIELPPGTMPVGRWGEVQTALAFVPAGSAAAAMTDVRRWVIGTGGQGPTTARCRPSAPVSATEEERGHLAEYPDSVLFEAEKGGTTLLLRTKKAPLVAWVPTIDGEPTGPARFVRGASGTDPAARISLPPAGEGELFFVPVWANPYRASTPPVSNFLSSNVARPGR